jgi:hypothetical protein
MQNFWFPHIFNTVTPWDNYQIGLKRKPVLRAFEWKKARWNEMLAFWVISGQIWDVKIKYSEIGQKIHTLDHFSPQNSFRMLVLARIYNKEYEACCGLCG